ncbi:hypothetical protein GCM10025795_43820 [Verticiella sediminum]
MLSISALPALYPVSLLLHIIEVKERSMGKSVPGLGPLAWQVLRLTWQLRQVVVPLWLMRSVPCGGSSQPYTV